MITIGTDTGAQNRLTVRRPILIIKVTATKEIRMLVFGVTDGMSMNEVGLLICIVNKL